MEKDKFESFLDGRYKEQLSWYDTKSQKNKQAYQAFQWGVVIASATLPALIVALPESLKWISVVLSIVLAIGTTALKTFKFQEIWINYRTIAETLKKEKVFFDAEIGDYADSENPELLFVERVENLISRENSLWIISVRDDDESKKSKTKKG